MKMTTNQKIVIEELRSENYSYSIIAQKLGLSVNTVKSYCLWHSVITSNVPRKNKAEKAALRVCEQCGKIIESQSQASKRFCSAKCRTAFWNVQKMLARKAGESPLSREKPPESAGLHAPPEVCFDLGR